MDHTVKFNEALICIVLVNFFEVTYPGQGDITPFRCSLPHIHLHLSRGVGGSLFEIGQPPPLQTVSALPQSGLGNSSEHCSKVIQENSTKPDEHGLNCMSVDNALPFQNFTD